MTFLLFVGKREVHVFDINNNYKRIYINGKKSFDYEITKADIAKEIGVSEKTIEREMKKTDKVIYVGSGYSGHWEIKE